MSTTKPKRNDPCPCGSGKLYKHCCKPSRRERFQRQRELALAPGPAEAPESGDASLAGQIRSMLQQVRGSSSLEQDPEFRQLLHLAEEMAVYEEMHDQIEAAARTLEDHRVEFEALKLDEAADLAHELFAEERFRAFRFGSKDVHRAFETVGYPQRHSQPTQRDGELMRDAILHLVDEDLRTRLSRKLLSWLPNYVSAGRYLDAWMIQYCAVQMLEDPNSSNPFLGEMFRHGFVAWSSEIEAQRAAMLRSLADDSAGIANLSPQEMQNWLQEEMEDPEELARLEALIGADTLFGDQARAEFRELERASLQLLGRDDAKRFLLSPEEVEPWMPTLLERLASLEEEARGATAEEAWDDDQILNGLQGVMLDVAQEMAPAVITPERLDQLVADLKAYQRDLHEAGERKLTMYTHATATVLERAEVPGEEPFAIGVCMASLHLMLIALGELDAAEEVES
jgi:hypothetical protein